jgi:hypothetical protein
VLHRVAFNADGRLLAVSAWRWWVLDADSREIICPREEAPSGWSTRT